MISLGEKIIGILGGMGPEATADLFMRIIRATPVKRDQDHFRVIIDSNSKIADRTPAILGTGPNPLPMMISLTNDNEFRQSSSCPAALCVIITADRVVFII